MSTLEGQTCGCPCFFLSGMMRIMCIRRCKRHLQDPFPDNRDQPSLLSAAFSVEKLGQSREIPLYKGVHTRGSRNSCSSQKPQCLWVTGSRYRKGSKNGERPLPPLRSGPFTGTLLLGILPPLTFAATISATEAQAYLGTPEISETRQA